MNFAWIMVENMRTMRNTLVRVKYGLPWECHLRCIFNYFKINLERFEKEKVKSSWFMWKESLKNMKIYKTKNCGYVFWP